ncbi:MAG: DUF2142 domain-containing protein [Lentisphaeria bacterium]|nr:DUF2142 domain-containing protein [Lentisphaeria bacterium]
MISNHLIRKICGFWKQRIVSLLMLFGLLVTVFFSFFRPEMKEEIFAPAYDSNSRLAHVGEIVNGTRIRQPIAVRHAVKDISIQFATFARKNHGKIRFYLKDDTADRILYDTLLDMASFKDNQYRLISFPKPIRIDRKHQTAFYLEGTPDCKHGNSITCWTNKSNMPCYQKNGIEGKQTILYNISRLKKQKISYIFPLFLFSFAAIVFLFFPIEPAHLASSVFIFCKNRIFALTLVLCTIIFLIVFHYSAPSLYSINSPFIDNTVNKMWPPKRILADTVINQPIPMKEPVVQIGIEFFTYARTNRGSIRFYVKDDTADRLLYSSVLKMEQIRDNSFKFIRFPKPLSIPPGHQASFYLQGTADCNPGNSVSCRMYPFYGKQNSITFQYTVLRKSFPVHLFILLLSGIFIFALLKDSFLLNFIRYPEKVFLSVGIVSALSITLCALPFSIVDAPAHLKRIYQVSEGKLFYRPENVLTSGREAHWSTILGSRDSLNSKYRTSFMVRSLFLDQIPFDCGQVNQKHYLMGYTPFAYLHSALAAFIARKAGLSLFNGIMLITIACIFVHLFSIYWVIRILPCFKWPALIIALMPGALWTGISFSADSFVIIAAFLFFAWCMKLRELQRPYTFNELAILAILSLLLSQCKFVYFPILAVMFLLPSENFRNRKQYWGFILSVIISSVFLGWLWNKLATDPTTLWNKDGRTTQEKMLFILTHPWQYFLEWWEAFSRTWRALLWSSVQQLGFHLLLRSASFYIVYYLVFLSYFFINREKSLAIRWRGFFIITVLFAIGLIYTAIYCANTIKGGIQGRYLIPLFPLLFLVFGQDKFGLPEKYLPYYKGFLVIFLIVTQILTADALRQAYWF